MKQWSFFLTQDGSGSGVAISNSTAQSRGVLIGFVGVANQVGSSKAGAA